MTTTGKYCTRCRTLHLGKTFDTSSSLPPGEDVPGRECVLKIGHLTLGDESSGCPLCRLFAISRNGDDTHNYRLRRYRLDGMEASDPATAGYAFVVCTGYANFLGTVASQRGFLGFEGAGRFGSHVVRRRADRVNFSLVRSWIADCLDNHPDCGRVDPKETSCMAIQVIDCATGRLCTYTPETKYAALSYVWGTNQSATEAADFITVLSDLPLLITDAMSVTLSLGLKYLWVDRYCISNTNTNLKHEQIQNMDLIYGRAEITLISLGDDPTCGLPGVSTEPRLPQISFQIKDNALLGSAPDPKIAIMRSKWWTRAWTLQEAICARRLLFFTQDQVYFECYQKHNCENIDYHPIPAGEPRDITGPWGWPSIPHTLKSSINDLQAIVSIYFTRDLTYATDTIPAISGIFHKHMRAHESTKHYFGLIFSASNPPQDVTVARRTSARQDDMAQSFLCALAWKVKRASRRQEYPSWSWSGWRGEGLVFEKDVLDLTAMVWIEWSNERLENIDDFHEKGGFDLKLSEQSHFIWLEAPAVHLRFSKPIGQGDGRHPLRIPVILYWGDGNEHERCYEEMFMDDFPVPEQLELYSNFVVFRIGESERGSFTVLIVADRNGTSERICCTDLSDGYREEWGSYFKQRQNISQDTDLGSFDQIVWTKQKVRIG